jgi:hypothetical protein
LRAPAPRNKARSFRRRGAHIREFAAGVPIYADRSELVSALTLEIAVWFATTPARPFLISASVMLSAFWEAFVLNQPAESGLNVPGNWGSGGRVPGSGGVSVQAWLWNTASNRVPSARLNGR